MFSKFVACLFLCWGVQSFPDGAPIDACVRERPNQPNHGQHRTQPLHTLPYRVTATATVYEPNAPITVSIEGSEPFKGFFIQARSVETDQWLGSWENAPNTTIHPECATITHADPIDKVRATLLWKAPPQHGRVYFTTVSYSLFGMDAQGFDAFRTSSKTSLLALFSINFNGSRYFVESYQKRGTVLKNYSTFWANLIAEVPQDPTQLQYLG